MKEMIKGKRNDKENVFFVYVWKQRGEGKRRYLYIFYLWEKLTNALKAFVNELFLKSFYGKRKINK